MSQLKSKHIWLRKETATPPQLLLFGASGKNQRALKEGSVKGKCSLVPRGPRYLYIEDLGPKTIISVVFKP